MKETQFFSLIIVMVCLGAVLVLLSSGRRAETPYMHTIIKPLQFSY